MDPRPLLSRFFDVAFRSPHTLRAEVAWARLPHGLIYVGSGPIHATITDVDTPDGPLFVMNGRLDQPDALFPGQFQAFRLDTSFRWGDTTSSGPQFSCSVSDPDEQRRLDDPLITGSNSFLQ